MYNQGKKRSSLDETIYSACYYICFYNYMFTLQFLLKKT